MTKTQLAVLAVLAFAGCSSAPKALDGPTEAVFAVPEDEPVFCVVSQVGRQDVEGYALLRYSAPFRDLRVLTVEHPNPAGCDVLLSLFQDGTAIWSPSRVKAYSGYTLEPLWEGSAKGEFIRSVFGFVALAPRLRAAFSSGGPLQEKLQRSRETGRAASAADAARLSASGLRPDAFYAAHTHASLLRLGGPAAGPVVTTAAAAPATAPGAPVAPRSELDDLPVARAANPRAVAVVIGVERYREKLPAADYAAADARHAAEYFRRVLGVSDENLALLVDERATKSDFEKYLEQWLPNHADMDAEVFVYFSGHGAPDAAKGDAYLVPYDGDPTYIKQTGYSLERLYDVLAKLPAKRVVVAMDSCFSGAGGRSVLAKGARPLVTIKTEALAAKLTVLTASAGDQVSNSDAQTGHGLFTFYLLKGLKEKNGDFKAAFESLKPEVSRAARRRYNADQTPQWRQGL